MLKKFFDKNLAKLLHKEEYSCSKLNFLAQKDLLEDLLEDLLKDLLEDLLEDWLKELLDDWLKELLDDWLKELLDDWQPSNLPGKGIIN